MIRLTFDAVDLSRVTVARAPDPLWEVALTARALRSACAPRLARDRRRVVRLAQPMRPVFELVTGGGFPDFLTPEPVEGCIDDALRLLDDVSSSQIRRELVGAGSVDDLSPWSARLARGDANSRRELIAAVRAFHAVAVAPFRDEREHALVADRALLGEAATTGGVEAMLARLGPRFTWSYPELRYEPPMGGGIGEILVELGGRGLLVYPSTMTADPLVLDLPGQRPVLVVPSRAELLADVVSAELADLVGRTRAKVLVGLTTGASTTELARRVGVSVASASEHARVLRGSGLVTTQRRAGSVLHTLTPLGWRLVLESGALPDLDDRALG